MIGLIQRVSHAKVEVAGNIVGHIERGLLVLIGIEKNDHLDNGKRLLERILSYRVFPDDEDRMNLSVSDIEGGLLLVPQFTLCADTDKGNRPGFSSAAEPSVAKTMFTELLLHASTRYQHLAFGQFGADMQVSLTNDGPVTFWLQTNSPHS